MDVKTKKPAVTVQIQQQKPSNPLLTVQTAKPATQNRNYELSTAVKTSVKEDN